MFVQLFTPWKTREHKSQLFAVCPTEEAPAPFGGVSCHQFPPSHVSVV
jgi:hypothetical protein